MPSGPAVAVKSAAAASLRTTPITVSPRAAYHRVSSSPSPAPAPVITILRTMPASLMSDLAGQDAAKRPEGQAGRASALDRPDVPFGRALHGAVGVRPDLTA